MNIFKKIWCRVFQTAFAAVMPFLPYRTPEVAGSISAVPQIIFGAGAKKPLVVTDGGIVRAGLLQKLADILYKSGVSFAVYDQTVANPTTENVEAARRTYFAEGCDCIIGFGGGSSMDCAKALGALIANPKKSLGQMKGVLKVRKKLPTLIAVPTTAGTGSETTLSAVIVDSESRHKYAINDFPLIPAYAVLDPCLTASLPPKIAAETGMDALTHAVEAYIGRSTTRTTRRQATEAVKLIFGNIKKVYRGGDETARMNMLYAAYLAGCAFTRSYVGYVHAIAHTLGGKYNVGHGFANAVILPTVLKAYGKKIHKKLKSLAIAAGVAQEDTPAERAASSFISAIEGLKTEFGIGNTFAELQKEDIPALAALADVEANPLYPVPVLFGKKELQKIYARLLQTPGNMPCKLQD